MSDDNLSGVDIVQRFAKERGDLFEEFQLFARNAHIRRAYDYGVTRRQVLEAVSCVLLMTGALTVQLGVRAMKQADA